MFHGDIWSLLSSDRAHLIDLSPPGNASGFKPTAPTAFGVKTELCESKRCLWETQHRSVSHNVILSRELFFVCVPAIERRRHRDHRDHRQSMNRSEGDKRACEGLKVHKTFLLCLFFPGTERTFEHDRDTTRYGGGQTPNGALNFTQPKENSNG